MYLKIRQINSKTFSSMLRHRVREWISKLKDASRCQNCLIEIKEELEDAQEACREEGIRAGMAVVDMVAEAMEGAEVEDRVEVQVVEAAEVALEILNLQSLLVTSIIIGTNLTSPRCSETKVSALKASASFKMTKAALKVLASSTSVRSKRLFMLAATTVKAWAHPDAISESTRRREADDQLN